MYKIYGQLKILSIGLGTEQLKYLIPCPGYIFPAQKKPCPPDFFNFFYLQRTCLILDMHWLHVKVWATAGAWERNWSGFTDRKCRESVSSAVNRASGVDSLTLTCLRKWITLLKSLRLSANLAGYPPKLRNPKLRKPKLGISKTRILSFENIFFHFSDFWVLRITFFTFQISEFWELFIFWF